MTGGRTPLGLELNKLDNRATGVKQRLKGQRLGRIIDVRTKKGDPVYEVMLEWLTPARSQGEISDWIHLEWPADFYASLIGSPRDLLSKGYYCKVKYKGTSSSRGVASIIHDPFYDKQDIAAWNELQVQGATFAPPGSGVI